MRDRYADEDWGREEQRKYRWPKNWLNLALLDLASILVLIAIVFVGLVAAGVYAHLMESLRGSMH